MITIVVLGPLMMSVARLMSVEVLLVIVTSATASLHATSVGTATIPASLLMIVVIEVAALASFMVVVVLAARMIILVVEVPSRWPTELMLLLSKFNLTSPLKILS